MNSVVIKQQKLNRELIEVFYIFNQEWPEAAIQFESIPKCSHTLWSYMDRNMDCSLPEREVH